MEEVEIRISVASDEAVAATEAETEALKRLDRQAETVSTKDTARSRKKQQEMDAEAKRLRDAIDITNKYNQAQKDLLATQNSRSRNEKGAGGRFLSNADQVKKDAEAQKQLTKDYKDQLLARTGYTVSELKKQVKAEQDAEKAKSKAVSDGVAARTRARVQEAEAAKAALARQRADAERSHGQALEDDKKFNRAREVENERSRKAEEQAANQSMARLHSAALQDDKQWVKDKKSREDEVTKLVKEADDLRAANQNRTQRAIEKAEDDSFKNRTSKAEKFANDLERIFGGGKGTRGGGGSFLTGGGGNGPVRRNQFSRNPFVDFGGRGAQPRTLGIGSLVGLAAAGAGPLGAAAGGLLGAVPGAAFGIGSAAAALKMSGIGSIAGDAAKIKTIQNQIATGVTKEAKGRAQIAAILKGMTPDQQKGLALWQGFQKVTATIGKNVQDTLLPAFGNVGKAISANSGTIARSIETAAKAMGDLLNNMSKFVSGGVGKVLFAGTSGAGNTFITGLMKTIGNLGQSFLAVGSASQKFMKQISAMATGATASLARFTTSRQGQDDLKGFFASAAKEIPIVINLVASLGKLLVTVLKAAMPFANQLVIGLTHMLNQFNAFLQSARGQQDMKNLFQSIKAGVEGAISAIKGFWPIVSATFSAIQKIIKVTADLFGKSWATGITLVAAYFSTKLVPGIQVATKELLKLAGTAIFTKTATQVSSLTGEMTTVSKINPWAAAIAGTAILIGSLILMDRHINEVQSDAKNTANTIKGMFQAIADKGTQKASLDVLNLQKKSQGAGIFSANQRINTLTKQGQDNGFTPKLNAQIQAAQLALARLRQAYRQTEQDIETATGKVADDNKKVSESAKKASDQVAQMLKTAKLNARGPTGLGGARVQPSGPVFDASVAVKMEAAFTKAYSHIGFSADKAGQATKLTMDKIEAIVKETGKAPSEKRIKMIVTGIAKESLDNIIRDIQKIQDKKFRVDLSNYNATMLDIKNIDNAKVKNKTFTIIGAYKIPRSPLIPTSQPVVGSGSWTGGIIKKSGGGHVPGMAGNDTVPAMLQPGEVVLNRNQQYDFGGPQVFDNYFAAKKKGYSGGGKVAARVIADSPDSGLVLNSKGAVISGVGIGIRGPGNTSVAVSSGQPVNPTDAEPDIAAVLALLKAQSGAIASWTKMKAGAKRAQEYYKDVVLHQDYDKRTNLNLQLDALSGKKGVTAKRVAIRKAQGNLAHKILNDQQSLRHANERYSVDGQHIRAIKKTIFTKVPGYDAFEQLVHNAGAEQDRITLEASSMPMLDPNAPPDSINGLNTLTNAWKNFNSQYNVAQSVTESDFSARVGFLTSILPGLKPHPKLSQLASAELDTDRSEWISVLGKSLSDAVPPGVGPGDTVTNTTAPGGGGGSNDTWADQPSTKTFVQQMAADAAQAAYSLISPEGTGDPLGWLAAMQDEKAKTWQRIQDLQTAKDFPGFADFRTDILDEITSDSGNYTSIVQAIQGGFAAAFGTASSNDQQIQQVIDDANTIMSQVNLGSTVEREQLGLLSDYLKSQVPSYETGASYVGKTGLALVHQGEKITTRGDATGVAGQVMHVTLHGGDPLTDALVQHLEPKISYVQGQGARRRARERRR